VTSWVSLFVKLGSLGFVGPIANVMVPQT
jgi:hypothetical protein